MMIQLVHGTAAAFALSALAAAQQPSLYIDFSAVQAGTVAPISGSYAAAAPTAGLWNDIDVESAQFSALPFTASSLISAAGSPSGVTLTIEAPGAFPDAIDFDLSDTVGNDGSLMDDIVTFEGLATFRFDGFPAGTYTVLTYAMAPDSDALETLVSVPGSSGGQQAVAGDFSGGFALGTTHANHVVTIAPGGTIEVQTDSDGGTDSINGIQIVPGVVVDGGLGQNYCTAAVNSTGSAARMVASGSTSAAANDLTLSATQLPNNQFGLFLTSRTQSFVSGTGGSSNGNLCLGGQIGRINIVRNSGSVGSFSLTVDLGTLPQGGGTVAAMAGDTWNFQAWYRDGVGLGSNFTDGLEITIQ